MKTLCKNGWGSASGLPQRCLWLALWCALCASSLHAAQQTLYWNASTSTNVDFYEFKLGTNSGSYQQSVFVTNRLATSTVFTLPAGRWYVVGLARNTNNGVSDPSNELQFDLPAAITIRLNLSSAPNPDGPWTDDPDVPPWIVSATEARKYWKLRVTEGPGP